MPRKLSASIFLLGMALLVLLKQPVLAYCACSESFYMDQCGCQDLAEDACPCQQNETSEEIPCDDCEKGIALDLDALFWNSLELPTNSELQGAALAQDEAEVTSFQPSVYLLPETRPPPPGGIPLYLFLGVMRL